MIGEGKHRQERTPANCITLHAVEAAFTPAPDSAMVEAYAVNL
jgi:hypothetical protein